MGVRARDVIVIARRRAGFTQHQLARRLGVPQATVARWEAGATEPKFQAVQNALAACGLDLTLGFANADEGSWNPLIFEQLSRTPAERLRKLSRGHFDRAEALGLLAASGLRTLVVGETAGALHGWPLLLDGPGAIDLLVHSGDRRRAREALAGFRQRKRIRLLDTLPGAHGYSDLARNAISMDIDGATVAVAALVDLLRVALTEDGGFATEFALALDATLQLSERLRRVDGAEAPSSPLPKLTEREARRRADEWLAGQTAQ
jgi:transcriptional regulator with XRE-family HTH domain